MKYALRVNDLSLKVGGKVLLDQLNVLIPAHEITLILGPNGAGKTLLLRCLAGLLRPMQGEVLTEAGENLHSKARSHLAKVLHWMPVSSPLPFDFTVSDLLLMGRYPHHQGYPSPADFQAVAYALQRMSLQNFARRVYNGLSRGEQTRVDIARALAADAPIMLLDEPFANLDIDASLQLIALMQELRLQGKTIVLSHHDLYSVRELGTYLIFLKQGQLVAQGACQDLFTPAALRQTYEVEARLWDDQQSGQQFVRFQALP